MDRVILPKRLSVAIGSDTAGDACLYVQVLRADGLHKRFLTREELDVLKVRYIDPLLNITIPAFEGKD